MKYLLQAKWALIACRDAVLCFFGFHDSVKFRGRMPFCRRCGEPTYINRGWWQ